MHEQIELLKKFYEAVEHAASIAQRETSEIKVVAVSKTKTAEMIMDFRRAGIKDFGENYVQEFTEKWEALQGNEINWHFIGHLQTNKVKYIIDKVHMIHTLDSIKLAKEIEKQAKLKSVKEILCLIEVNTGGEDQKSGVNPSELEILIQELKEIKVIKLKGLMTIPPAEEPEEARKYFKKLYELKENLIAKDLVDKNEFTELSMGMSADFDVAIEEGATIIRPGRILFGDRN